MLSDMWINQNIEVNQSDADAATPIVNTAIEKSRGNFLK